MSKCRDLLFFLSSVFCLSPWAQIQGKVVNQQGLPLPQAQVVWVEADLATVTDAQGDFSFAALPIKTAKSFRGRIRWQGRPDGLFFDLNASNSNKAQSLWSIRSRFEVFATSGRQIAETWSQQTQGFLQLNTTASGATSPSPLWMRVTLPNQSLWYRLHSSASGWQIAPVNPNSIPQPTMALARKSGSPATKITLRTQANGYTTRQLAFASGTSVAIPLLPATATLKERLGLLLGDSLTLKMAWLQDPGDGQTLLHWADLGDLDSTAGAASASVTTAAWKTKSFADSKGATLPSWALDGKSLAYETGREASTIATSRIYLQPLTGARKEGPAYPATNPRFATFPLDSSSSAIDTALLWCTSGKGASYDDATSATLIQAFKNGVLMGQPQSLTTGSYNGGLSPDGRFLAAGYPRGVVLDLTTQERVNVHVYPKSTGGNDSLQICNVSISRDMNHPDRMLFIDFGVSQTPGFPNLIRPATYAQHAMLILADFATDAPGHIVDFIDTPEADKVAHKSWEDPEWSTHADFAIATTRLDDGNTISQPDVYLIRLSTHETVKLFSGISFLMPIAWIGHP